MAASFTTGYPSTFGRYEKTGYECPTGYPTSFTPSATSTFGGYPSTTPSTFGTFPAEWSRFGGFGGNFNTPSTFGGYPWSNFGSFGGNTSYPAEWSRFAGYNTPSTFGGFNTPSTFGGYPWTNEWSRFAGFNTPSTFGGYPWTNEWSRFGGFGGNVTPFSFGGYPWTNEWSSNWTAGYPWTNEWSRFGGFNTPSTFGGYPWTNESTFGYPWSRFGGYESFPWSRFGGNFGGFESFPWSRFGGDFTSMYPWARDFSSRYNVPTSWFGNTFDWSGRNTIDDFERSLNNVSRELFNIKNLFDFGKRKEATTGNRGAYSTSMVQLPSRPTSSLEYYTFQNPIRFDAYGQRWLSLCFDLPSYKPEEIQVTLYSKATPAPYIEILASHDVKDTKEHNIKRTYERKFYFPSDLNLKPEDIAKLELKSHFSNDGVLYIEAKLPHLSAEDARKERSHYPIWSVPIKTEKRDM